MQIVERANAASGVIGAEILAYSVPGGQTLYVTSFSMALTGVAASVTTEFWFQANAVVYELSAQQPAAFFNFPEPFAIDGNIGLYATTPSGGSVWACLRGFVE